MRKIVVFIALMLASCYAVAAQSDCPQDKVCLSRETALKALEAADRVKALEAELKAKDAAYAAVKDLLADMREQFARTSGENTILKQRAISDAAMIELLMKMVRPKQNGIFNIHL